MGESLEQELEQMVAQAVPRCRDHATPRTYSTTQPMQPSPLHQELQQEQLASCPTVLSEFGSVCNHAIRQVVIEDGEVTTPLGRNEAVAMHHVQQGDERFEPLAELEIDSCPGDGYPPLHVLD